MSHFSSDSDRRMTRASRLSLRRSKAPRSASRGGGDMRLRGELERYSQCRSAAYGVARRYVTPPTSRSSSRPASNTFGLDRPVRDFLDPVPFDQHRDSLRHCRVQAVKTHSRSQMERRYSCVHLAQRRNGRHDVFLNHTDRHTHPGGHGRVPQPLDTVHEKCRPRGRLDRSECRVG